MNDRTRGIGLAFAAAAISGVSVFLNSYAVREFGDATLYTTAKNLLAALVLGGILLALTARRSPHGLTPPRTLRDVASLVAVGIVGGGIPFVLFFQGLAEASSASAAFIHKTLVIWVAVLAVTLLRERFGALHAAAIALLVVGQAAASGGVGPFALDRGEAMILVATLLWSIEVVVAKPLLRGLSPLTVASARMGIGVVLLFAIVLASGELSRLAAVTPQGWLWVLVTGVILSAFVATWYSALARAQAVDVTAVLVFGAVITAALSSGVRGVSLVPSAAGLALITFGTVLTAIVAIQMRTARRPEEVGRAG